MSLSDMSRQSQGVLLVFTLLKNGPQEEVVFDGVKEKKSA